MKTVNLGHLNGIFRSKPETYFEHRLLMSRLREAVRLIDSERKRLHTRLEALDRARPIVVRLIDESARRWATRRAAGYVARYEDCQTPKGKL